MKKLSIIIPCFNEEKTISTVIKKIHETKIELEKEIIVINDGSTDKTKELIDGPLKKMIHCIIHKKNGGKGSALSIGFKKATGDYLIIQDADLEYNPVDYQKLINKLKKKQAKAVYGSRLLNKENEKYFKKINLFANKLLSILSNQFTNQKLSDMETCYKLLTKEIYKNIHIESPRFGIEPEITAKISNLNQKIEEVPISYKARNNEEGKKIGWLDGIEAIYSIFKFALKYPTQLK